MDGPCKPAPGAAPEGGNPAAGGAGCRGALLFGYFFLGKQEKVTRPGGRNRKRQITAVIGRAPGIGLLDVATLHPAYELPKTRNEPAHAIALSTASKNTFGDASSISRVAISTATCTLLPRVIRSPVAASVIR